MEDKSVALKNLFNISTGILVLLQIVTLGIYPLVWLARRKHAANAIVGDELVSETFMVTIIVLTALSLLLIPTGFSSLFSLAVGIMWIVWSFKARRILQTYAATQCQTALRMNSLYTFFFTVFYVNYCINDLPHITQRQTALRPTAA